MSAIDALVNKRKAKIKRDFLPGSTDVAGDVSYVQGMKFTDTKAGRRGQGRKRQGR